MATHGPREPATAPGSTSAHMKGEAGVRDITEQISKTYSVYYTGFAHILILTATFALTTAPQAASSDTVATFTPVNDDNAANVDATSANSSPSLAKTTSDSVIHAATPNFADQSQSTLMTLPRELRNQIFGYVFWDNVDWARKEVRHEGVVGTKAENVPDRISFDSASPPSKDSILPCRQLYCEMKQMQAAAYRDYWSSNRFLYTPASGMRTVPSADDVRHMQHISLPAIGREVGLHFIDLVFKEAKWGAWLLPPDRPFLESDDIDGDHCSWFWF